MKIETDRLILRDYVISDSKDIVLKINNLEVSKYLAMVPYPYKPEDAEWYINHCAEKKEEVPRVDYSLAITLKENGEFVGGVGLSNIDTYVGSAGLGYWIAEEYWMKGFVSEAVSALIDFAFGGLKLNRVFIPAYVPNIGSNGLAEKLGFKFEGITRESSRTKSTGKVYDTNNWGLLRGEWKK